MERILNSDRNNNVNAPYTVLVSPSYNSIRRRVFFFFYINRHIKIFVGRKKAMLAGRTDSD